ncbi:DNA modification system-associated small protein [Achromobacter sp. D10]|uniref:DNA modification system-associated small protein n=1 Tax=Achromobacter sp. D10 TaxID=3110765 RepID=UPI002B476F9C|nr:DNA modification system-associated small protein [Achromobacter sp. D10]MEB3095588.1 DNA modification system-associated small protein [Achromobacter sp. D10]
MADELIENGYLNDLPLWSDEDARTILESICEKHSVPVDVLAELVTVQRERQHQERAHGIMKRFEEILALID